jgi:CheY-like chemotaxis protein
VAEAAKLLRAAIPSSIIMETDIPPKLPAVQGNSTQLHQIVMNLGTNAWYAMRDQPGRLSLRLDAGGEDESPPGPATGIRPGPFVRLTVTDTGCGMDAAVQERVYEPFFTTKGPGEGTGLGLSVVHGIVRAHQGAIRLTSEVGRGTTFEIILPALEGPPPRDADPLEEIPRGQGERILLVDDEEALVRVGEQTLHRLGYRPMGVSQVLEALALLERDPHAFDLVVTDLTMPGLTGLQFAACIRTLRKDLPVVVTTGHINAISPEAKREAGVREVLPKPCTVLSLAVALRRHLPLPAHPPEHVPHPTD